jgi:hypothetical protein
MKLGNRSQSNKFQFNICLLSKNLFFLICSVYWNSHNHFSINLHYNLLLLFLCDVDEHDMIYVNDMCL